MPARLSSASSSSRCRVWQCSPRSPPPRWTGSTELQTGPRRAPAHPSGPTLSPSSPLVNVGKQTTMHRTKGPKKYIMCQIDIGEFLKILSGFLVGLMWIITNTRGKPSSTTYLGTSIRSPVSYCCLILSSLNCLCPFCPKVYPIHIVCPLSIKSMKIVQDLLSIPNAHKKILMWIEFIPYTCRLYIHLFRSGFPIVILFIFDMHSHIM